MQIYFHDYRVIKEIGRGQFGTVYLCNNENNEKFAVKRIRVNENDIQDAKKEALMLKSSKHKNILGAK